MIVIITSNNLFTSSSKMSVRKKQVTSPARYTLKDNQYSPRNAVQEAFISETSLGNNVEAEYGMNGGGNFYSP